MVCFNPHTVTQSRVAAERKKSPPKPKHPLQVSEEIHSLVSQMAKDRNLSLEQVVGKAVIKEAKAALDTPDGDKQRLYFSLAKNAENGMWARNRDVQPRCIVSTTRGEKNPPPPPPLLLLVVHHVLSVHIAVIPLNTVTESLFPSPHLLPTPPTTSLLVSRHCLLV